MNTQEQGRMMDIVDPQMRYSLSLVNDAFERAWDQSGSKGGFFDPETTTNTHEIVLLPDQVRYVLSFIQNELSDACGYKYAAFSALMLAQDKDSGRFIRYETATTLEYYVLLGKTNREDEDYALIIHTYSFREPGQDFFTVSGKMFQKEGMYLEDPIHAGIVQLISGIPDYSSPFGSSEA